MDQLPAQASWAVLYPEAMKTEIKNSHDLNVEVNQ
jgi:hypothetical protein